MTASLQPILDIAALRDLEARALRCAADGARGRGRRRRRAAPGRRPRRPDRGPLRPGQQRRRRARRRPRAAGRIPRRDRRARRPIRRGCRPMPRTRTAPIVAAGGTTAASARRRAAGAGRRRPLRHRAQAAGRGAATPRSSTGPTRAGAPVLALDVPTGLDAETGFAHSPCVRATATATFIAYKPGLLTADGPDCCGDVTVHALGLDVAPRRARASPRLACARAVAARRCSRGARAT